MNNPIFCSMKISALFMFSFFLSEAHAQVTANAPYHLTKKLINDFTEGSGYTLNHQSIKIVTPTTMTRYPNDTVSRQLTRVSFLFQKPDKTHWHYDCSLSLYQNQTSLPKGTQCTVTLSGCHAKRWDDPSKPRPKVLAEEKMAPITASSTSNSIVSATYPKPSEHCNMDSFAAPSGGGIAPEGASSSSH